MHDAREDRFADPDDFNPRGPQDLIPPDRSFPSMSFYWDGKALQVKQAQVWYGPYRLSATEALDLLHYLTHLKPLLDRQADEEVEW